MIQEEHTSPENTPKSRSRSVSLEEASRSGSKAKKGGKGSKKAGKASKK